MVTLAVRFVLIKAEGLETSSLLFNSNHVGNRRHSSSSDLTKLAGVLTTMLTLPPQDCFRNTMLKNVGAQSIYTTSVLAPRLTT